MSSTPGPEKTHIYASFDEVEHGGDLDDYLEDLEIPEGCSVENREVDPDAETGSVVIRCASEALARTILPRVSAHWALRGCRLS